MTNINFNFKKENTFQELQEVLKKNKLYEDTYYNSRFLSMIQYKSDEPFPHYGFDNYENETIEIVNFTTVTAINEKGKIIGILVFENYKEPKRVSTFLCAGKRIKYKMSGFVCLYVTPKYRENGIAQNMVKVFNDQYTFNHEVIQLISGVQATANILKEYGKSFVLTKSPYNKAVWKEVVKSYITYYANKEEMVV